MSADGQNFIKDVIRSLIDDLMVAAPKQCEDISFEKLDHHTHFVDCKFCLLSEYWYTLSKIIDFYNWSAGDYAGLVQKCAGLYILSSSSIKDVSEKIVGNPKLSKEQRAEVAKKFDEIFGDRNLIAFNSKEKIYLNSII